LSKHPPILLLLLVASCAAAPADFSLEGRQACVERARGVHSAAEFFAAGRSEEEAARFFGRSEEGVRRLRCALAAYEAATAVNPGLRAPYCRLAVIYGELRREEEGARSAKDCAGK
jgi:hypothetical protein